MCVRKSIYRERNVKRGGSRVQVEPLTKEIRLKIFDPIISNSFPVRYYGISGTNLPDIP